MKNDSEKYNIVIYQELIGRLVYLMAYIRSDWSFALSCLSKFNQEQRMIHRPSLKRILRYLKGTIHYRLVFFNKNRIKGIECETDASW